MKKIISIKNYSTFKNFTRANTGWDCSLKKFNLVFAPNGSGKTSLSIIFESLKGENELVNRKKNFVSTEDPEIVFIDDDNKEVKFHKKKWNKNINEIEVFNSFYLENNVYKITPKDHQVILGMFKRSKMDDYVKEANKKREKLRNAQRIVTNIDKQMKINPVASEIQKLKSDFENAKEEQARVHKEYKEYVLIINEVYKDELDNYKKCINKYLRKLSNALCITNISIITDNNNRITNLMYDIKIEDYLITIGDRSTNSLKYYFSEGDKNALALSFYLSKFDVIDNVSDYIVVIDDPFTSFDTHRKSITVSEIVKLSNKVKQMFVFTHDLHFADEIEKKSYDDVLTLQIKRSKGDNSIDYLNTSTELLTGLMKDIVTMNDFIINGVRDDGHKIQVARCIRPALEGIFRIKFYESIKQTEWLGDFINHIRNADESSPFYRIKDYLELIEDVNDYSKQYHHSSAAFSGLAINEAELNKCVKNALNLIQVI